LGLAVIHLILLHRSGSNTGVVTTEYMRFGQYFLIKDFFTLLVCLWIFFFLVFFYPNLLSHPDNFIPANPLVTPPHIVPEWYFLPFYAILRAIPNKLGGVIIMFSSIGILFLLPFFQMLFIRKNADLYLGMHESGSYIIIQVIHKVFY
jgi:quinol-cytochrome oxidoreductase complex cytochrome b subunit